MIIEIFNICGKGTTRFRPICKRLSMEGIPFPLKKYLYMTRGLLKKLYTEENVFYGKKIQFSYK